MIKPVITINVTPNLPWPLEQLRELALNLRWSWDADCIALFRRLDPELWRATDHNPVQLLGMLSQERLDDAATDASFLAHMQRICASRDAEHDSRNTWFLREHGEQPQGTCIAYFSMEFGLAESLRTYSGVWAYSAATTSRAPATWGCRSWASACCIRRATFTSI